MHILYQNAILCMHGKWCGKLKNYANKIISQANMLFHIHTEIKSKGNLNNNALCILLISTILQATVFSLHFTKEALGYMDTMINLCGINILQPIKKCFTFKIHITTNYQRLCFFSTGNLIYNY